MDLEAERVDLLLAEKAYIENRISSNLDLQIKVLGTGLTAVITALGWVFSANVCASSRAMILLTIVSISAISVLMTVLYGGYALGGIKFKQEVLGGELQSALGIKPSVVGALGAIRLGVAGVPIKIATVSLCLAHIFLSIAVYAGALCSLRCFYDRPRLIGVFIAGLLLAASIVGLVALMRAAQKS